MKKFLQNHVFSFLFLLLNLLSFPLFLLPFLYTKSSSMIIPISGYELLAFYEDTGSYLSYGSKSFLFLLISFIGLSLTSLLSLFASRNFKKTLLATDLIFSLISIISAICILIFFHQGLQNQIHLNFGSYFFLIYTQLLFISKIVLFFFQKKKSSQREE